ncbi:hypothetical protein T07_13860 [Trichinella nelsoni]|uniref:Uncharacterized protein n=1 Tax=Trichinella nelsoni TaxID=6336 RepID=A0A0V0RWA6_9BILA|nr:hypothetical protein T07_13860 [Trichinella nelsoni]
MAQWQALCVALQVPRVRIPHSLENVAAKQSNPVRQITKNPVCCPVLIFQQDAQFLEANCGARSPIFTASSYWSSNALSYWFPLSIVH